MTAVAYYAGLRPSEVVRYLGAVDFEDFAIGNEDARKALRVLAGGQAGARATTEAAAAVERLTAKVP